MKTVYDVLVAGGGIHGVGVAQAAAAVGYSTLLLEQNKSLAMGTSCKSSKLIHGGLRYLESGQFNLVKECLSERECLLNNAPHLVRLKKFFIPIYKNTKRSPLQIRLGLSLYALLNGFKKSSQFQSIPKAEWENLDGLTTQNLKHVFQYWDAQTDDAKLTKAVMASAKKLGADLLLNSKIQSIKKSNNTWQVNYLENGQTQQVSTKVLINTTGAWVNTLLGKVEPQTEQLPVDLIQGTHIVLNDSTTQGIYYLEAPQDQRAIFIMPWYGKTLVGTTEKNYTSDPANVAATQEEINYLIEVVKYYFPKYNSLTIDDVVDEFAGIRVLPANGDNAFDKPRETIIYEDIKNAPGIFTIYGGKLTAYRATAENMIHKIVNYLPEKSKNIDTKTLKLPE